MGITYDLKKVAEGLAVKTLKKALEKKKKNTSNRPRGANQSALNLKDRQQQEEAMGVRRGRKNN